ncbi:hypothetical protein HG530_003224 [Fusarium avenaceum]|nr:hypothetical protein HG530_003224 [Fusarium avenaceum]
MVKGDITRSSESGALAGFCRFRDRRTSSYPARSGVSGTVCPYARLTSCGRLVVSFAEGFQSTLEQLAQTRAQSGEYSSSDIRKEDAGSYVSSPAVNSGQFPIARIYLHKIAVLLAKSAVAGKCGESEVGKGREGLYLGCAGVG